ncbi:hypothetical protein Tco_0859452 [Tanacetum coccineum]|uniref:Uncharacterized protein n=1 Tax=Tanacetum coccineum TaxID=301880 RepID=A0ABQ5BC47_9ASTR
MPACLARLLSYSGSYVPFIWFTRSWESRNIATFAISISWAIRRPASNASYYASFPAPDPSELEAPLV